MQRLTVAYSNAIKNILVCVCLDFMVLYIKSVSQHIVYPHARK